MWSLTKNIGIRIFTFWYRRIARKFVGKNTGGCRCSAMNMRIFPLFGFSSDQIASEVNYQWQNDCGYITYENCSYPPRHGESGKLPRNITAWTGRIEERRDPLIQREPETSGSDDGIAGGENVAFCIDMLDCNGQPHAGCIDPQRNTDILILLLLNK